MKRLASTNGFYEKTKYPYSVVKLRKIVLTNEAWNNFADYYCKTELMDTENKIMNPKNEKDEYVIAVKEKASGGSYRFSGRPKVHATEKESRNEVERLVKEFPEQTFAYFKKIASARSSKIEWMK